jgi:hypothetical protein
MTALEILEDQLFNVLRTSLILSGYLSKDASIEEARVKIAALLVEILDKRFDDVKDSVFDRTLAVRHKNQEIMKHIFVNFKDRIFSILEFPPEGCAKIELFTKQDAQELKQFILDNYSKEMLLDSRKKETFLN